MCNALYIKVYNLEKAYRGRIEEVEAAIDKCVSEGDKENAVCLRVARETFVSVAIDLDSLLSTE